MGRSPRLTRAIWVVCVILFAVTPPIALLSRNPAPWLWLLVPVLVPFQAAWWWEFTQLKKLIVEKTPDVLQDNEGSLLWPANDWDVRQAVYEEPVAQTPELRTRADRVRALRWAPIAGTAIGLAFAICLAAAGVGR